MRSAACGGRTAVAVNGERVADLIGISYEFESTCGDVVEQISLESGKCFVLDFQDTLTFSDTTHGYLKKTEPVGHRSLSGSLT